MQDYYLINHLESVLNRGNSLICRALLKYGSSNFSLEILEYCEPADAKSREQYYLDILDPDYNILKIAGSPFGCTRSEETKAKMSLAKKGKNHTEETKAKMSAAKIGNENSKGRPRPEGAGSPAVAIEVFDLLTQQKTTYPSISAAAKALDVDGSNLRKYLSENTSRLYKRRYQLQKVENTIPYSPTITIPTPTPAAPKKEKKKIDNNNNHNNKCATHLFNTLFV